MHKIKHKVLQTAAAFVIGQNIKSVPRSFIWAECKHIAPFLVLLPLEFNFFIGDTLCALAISFTCTR
jgi:hypothetical protein